MLSGWDIVVADLVVSRTQRIEAGTLEHLPKVDNGATIVLFTIEENTFHT